MNRPINPEAQIRAVVDRAHPVEAVETGVPVFVGYARAATAAPVELRSYSDFEQRFGETRYRLGEAVRLFFEHGGRRCFVSSVTGEKPTADALRAGLAAAKETVEADLLVMPDAVLVGPQDYGTLARDALKDCATMRRFALLEILPGVNFGTGWLSWGAAYPLPAGQVAGMYSAEDEIHGVWKAPAELHGATLARDGEWKYVTVRRLSILIERSLERGLDWVAHEPRKSELFTLVRGVVKHFLLDLWRKGALVGAEPEKAFFVRCDGTTMGIEDLDDGDFIIEVSFAPVKPAEFVVLRIVEKAGS